MIFHGYVVQLKCDSDDKIALEYTPLFPLATCRETAWKNFLKTAGKTRAYWNKLGYVSKKIRVQVEFVDDSDKSV